MQSYYKLTTFLEAVSCGPTSQAERAPVVLWRHEVDPSEWRPRCDVAVARSQWRRSKHPHRPLDD